MITKGKINLEIFHTDINVFIVDTYNEIPEYIRKGNVMAGGYCAENKDTGEIRIYIFSDMGVSAISHESVHAKNRIFNHMGYEADSKNDEVEAYLVGYIAKKVTDLYWKHNNKKNDNKEKH